MKTINKYLNYGYEILEKEEVLEILLYLSGYREPKKKLYELLNYYGSCELVLKSTNNLSLKLNKRFIIITKLLNDISAHSVLEKIKEEQISLNNSRGVVEFFRRKIAIQNVEHFYILLLDNANHYISYKLISKGTIDKAYIFVRNIVANIINYNVKSVIICHNHPSGTLEPSEADKRVTERIKKALEIIEINLIDHIIVSSKGYYSFAERGLI